MWMIDKEECGAEDKGRAGMMRSSLTRTVEADGSTELVVWLELGRWCIIKLSMYLDRMILSECVSILGRIPSFRVERLVNHHENPRL